MKGSRTTVQVVLLLILFVSLAAAGFYYLEWEKPTISLDKSFDAIGKTRDVIITLRDKRSGIRNFSIALVQDKHEFVIASEEIPYKGTYEKVVAVKIVPKELKVKDGEAVFTVKATDFSPLRNTSVLQAKVIIDSTPPRIALLTRAHNINPGGTCLAIYRVTKAVQVSGVKCGNAFFTGYLVRDQGNPYYVCYFAVPRDVSNSTVMAVSAADRAGNQAIVGIPFYIRSVRPFRKDTVTVSDKFVQQKAVEFQEEDSKLSGKSPEEIFAYVNTQLRVEDDKKIQTICLKTGNKQLWQGIFLRLKNGAPKALFGDERTYLYQGKSMGTSVHLGIDLASTAQANIEAANSGVVLYAGNLGIYGNAVIIDHGQGISSQYGHMSSISVKEGQQVTKGQIIGNTGATGFAGGDHLHFSVLVGGVFVDPKEWWDPHWIKDNVEYKLELAKTL
ncbi:MAG: M23 family metallopeptidase [Desulfomonilia bacterium]|jgi:murein DD-endopeptidase MepM/ murein hydrolase activator NlpD